MWLFYYPVAIHYRLSDVIGSICLLAEQELRESGDDLTWCVQLRAEKRQQYLSPAMVKQHLYFVSRTGFCYERGLFLNNGG